MHIANASGPDAADRKRRAVRRPTDEGFGDGGEIPRIGVWVFRVPLHADYPSRCVLNRLDDAIIGTGDDREAIRNFPHGLMVAGPHRDLGPAEDATEPRIGVHAYPLRHHECVRRTVVQRLLTEVLHQRAAAGDIKDL